MPIDKNRQRVSAHPPVFLYSAKTQFSNAGDALINRELLKLLRSHGEIQAMSGGAPADFINEVGLQAREVVFANVSALLTAALRLRLSGRCVYLVQTPGDMGASAVNTAALLRALAAPLFAAAGIRVIQVGASLGHMTPLQLRLFAWRTRFMHGLGLRDPISLMAAQTAGFQHTAYFPDLAFAYDGIPSGKKRHGGQIALSFRDDFISQDERHRMMEKIRSGLDQLTEKPQLSIVVQVSKDRIFAEIMKEELSDWSPTIVELSSLSALRDYYSDIDIMISNRLHALLWSGLAGAVPVAVANREVNRKIIGLYEGVKLSEFVVLDNQVVNIEKFWNNLDQYRSAFSAAYRAQHEKIHPLMNEIISGDRSAQRV